MEGPPQLHTHAPSNRAEEERLARFMIHDRAFVIFRRFHHLNLQNLLYLQAKVSFLEHQIEQGNAQSSGLDGAGHDEQLALAINEVLHCYNRALIAQSSLDILERPQSTTVSDLLSWANDNHCLEATQYLNVTNDLFCLGSNGESRGWAYRVVEKLVWRFFAKPTAVGANPEAGTLYVYDDNNIRRTVRALLTFLSAFTLLIPIIILFFLEKGYPSLIVIVVCTTLFSILLAVTTEAGNHELMMAAAAYGAVLVVFLGSSC